MFAIFRARCSEVLDSPGYLASYTLLLFLLLHGYRLRSTTYCVHGSKKRPARWLKSLSASGNASELDHSPVSSQPPLRGHVFREEIYYLLDGDRASEFFASDIAIAVSCTIGYRTRFVKTTRLSSTDLLQPRDFDRSRSGPCLAPPSARCSSMPPGGWTRRRCWRANGERRKELAAPSSPALRRLEGQLRPKERQIFIFAHKHGSKRLATGLAVHSHLGTISHRRSSKKMNRIVDETLGMALRP